MQSYLSQLLGDLRDRHGQFPPEPNIRALAPDPNFPEFMTDSMNYLYGPQYAMGELFDLGVEAFPPPKKLTEAQAEALAQGILDLWRSLNLFVDLPAGLPLYLAYPVLLRFWREEPVPIVRDGRITLECCEYEPVRCPWPTSFCMCNDHPTYPG
jgi:hypothetical protein